ncbi:hypothetical protein [Streptomyces sp. NPDC016845]|uniref:hypothetical protein n=1 Tax=Streptomyces sp. NPDC016845 TaxID=3364972 RepID=UPI00379F55EA
MTDEPRRRTPLHQPLSALILAGIAGAAWAAWLGWDQHRDIGADGTETGPYEAWQVLGLVVTLLIPVVWAASRDYVPGAVIGTTAGLTIAAYIDWSDDASGLFGIGVLLLMLGSLAATTVVSTVVRAAASGRGGSPSNHVTA